MGKVVQFPGPRTDASKVLSLDILCPRCDEFVEVDVDVTQALTEHNVDAVDLLVGRHVNCALLAHHRTCDHRHAT